MGFINYLLRYRKRVRSIIETIAIFIVSVEYLADTWTETRYVNIVKCIKATWISFRATNSGPFLWELGWFIQVTQDNQH